MGFCNGIRFTRSLQWQWKWIHNGCIDNDNNDRRCNCHNELNARQCQRATIPKLMVDTTSSATFVLAIKYKFHTLPIYKGNLKDQQQGWCKMYEKSCFPTPVGLQCKIWQDKVYWRGCEASIPICPPPPPSGPCAILWITKSLGAVRHPTNAQPKRIYWVAPRPILKPQCGL